MQQFKPAKYKVTDQEVPEDSHCHDQEAMWVRASLSTHLTSKVISIVR